MNIRHMSEQHDVFTQRNNALYPDETCWPTSMVQALHIAGAIFPKGKYPQPEDNLCDFMMKDRRIRDLHHTYDPDRHYKPWQVHDVLSKAANHWLGTERCIRKTGVTADVAIALLEAGNIIVTSGTFPYYSGRPINHAICIHGVTDEGFLICDPWGDYTTLYSDGKKCVRDKVMPFHDYAAYMKGSCICVKL